MYKIIFFFFLIIPIIGVGQERFDATLNFKLLDNGKMVSYSEFIDNWEIIDNSDHIIPFSNDSLSYELDTDKKLYVKYSDSLSTFSIRLGSWRPGFKFKLKNPDGDEMPILICCSEGLFSIESLDFNKNGYLFLRSNEKTRFDKDEFLKRNGMDNAELIELKE